MRGGSLGQWTLPIIAYGILGDQKEAERDWAEAAAILNVNFTSSRFGCDASWRIIFEKQGLGQIVGIGSVAGDCGRRTNYVYGAAKAGVETLLEGRVRHRLAAKGNCCSAGEARLRRYANDRTPATIASFRQPGLRRWKDRQRHGERQVNHLCAVFLAAYYVDHPAVA